MTARGDAGLERRLGTADAVVIGLGSMVGAGVFGVWGPAASAAGAALPWALALAAAVAFCNAWSTARLAAVHPASGGAYVYGREQLGHLWGFLAGWCFVVGKTASCAAMAWVVGSYLAPGHARWVAAAAVVIVTGLNLLGVQRSAAVTRVVVGVVLLTLIGLLAGTWAGHGLTTEGASVATSGHSRGLGGLLEGAGLLFFAFAGYARIATLGAEVRDPARTIPRAVALTLPIVLVLYALVAATLMAVTGVDALAGRAAPLADLADQLGGPALATWVRTTAGVAAFGALLTLLLGISRTTLAMASHADLPTWLGVVEDGVPRRAEVVVGGLVLLAVLLGDLRGAVGFSSFAVLTYYAVANASAVALGRAGVGRAVALAGLAGCVLLSWSLPPRSVVPGAVVVAVGVLLHVRRRRADPTLEA